MRKANYDKFPSTKLTGMLVQGWDSIISMLKKKMDARKVLAVDLYTGEKCWMLFQKNSPEE